MGIFQSIERVRNLVRKELPRSWELSTVTSPGQPEGSVLSYTGNRGNRDYIFERILGGKGQIRSCGRQWSRLTSRRLFESKVENRLYMMEVAQGHDHQIAHSQTSFYIPQWISTSLDISVGMEELMRKESLRSDVRKLKKNNLSFHISTDTSEFDTFYHDMYVPHVSAAHGASAVIVDYQRALADFARSDLLLILHGQTPIAGALIVNDDDQSKIWLLGVRQPSAPSIKLGALSAAYYFSVEHLLQQGVTRLDLGLSRPFLSDGVLRYKRKWNPEISGVESRGWLLGIPRNFENVLAILKTNPFILIRDGEPWINVFIDDITTIEETALEKEARRHAICGISGVQVLDTKGGFATFPIERNLTKRPSYRIGAADGNE